MCCVPTFSGPNFSLVNNTVQSSKSTELSVIKSLLGKTDFP